MARTKKSTLGSSRVMRDVEDYLRETEPQPATRRSPAGKGQVGGPRLFWPGGAGGGGRRRGSPRSAVVRPHRRTSRRCTRCGQFHTQAEHARHGDPPSAAPRQPRPVRSRPAPARGAQAKTRRPRTAPAAPQRLLEVVRDAVASAPARDRVGDAVFVSRVYRRVAPRIGMTLPEFKQWLIQQNQAQALRLERLDLVDMVPERLWTESEIEHMNATFHLIVDDTRRRRWR